MSGDPIPDYPKLVRSGVGLTQAAGRWFVVRFLGSLWARVRFCYGAHRLIFEPLMDEPEIGAGDDHGDEEDEVSGSHGSERFGLCFPGDALSGHSTGDIHLTLPFSLGAQVSAPPYLAVPTHLLASSGIALTFAGGGQTPE